MRRLVLVILLVCMAAPAAALAARRAPGDGTLSVRNGVGLLRLDIEGAVIGRFDRGQLEVTSPSLADCASLDVWGPVRVRERARTGWPLTCVFTRVIGRASRAPIRFRIVLEEQETLVLRNGVGFDVSAVGRGRGMIRGGRGIDGVFSLNGAKFRSLPDAGALFTLGATLP